MNLKKFMKKTNIPKKVNNIKSYSLDSAFNYLKVSKIINYYTLEVIIYNKGVFNKWIFTLKDVDIFDDKLSETNKHNIMIILQNLLMPKYFRFNIIDINNHTICGRLLRDNSRSEEESINTIIVNNTIHCLVLKDKIRRLNMLQRKEEGSHMRRKLKPIVSSRDVEKYGYESEC